MNRLTVLYGIVALSGFSAAAYVARIARGRWTLTRRGAISAFLLLGVGMTLSVPEVGAQVDQWSGIHELWRLAAHLCLLGIAVASEAQLLSLTYTYDEALPRLKRRLMVFGAGAVALI